jgi:hypothetical protein
VLAWLHPPDGIGASTKPGAIHYLDAHTLHATRAPDACGTGATGGPLPWLPAPPDPDSGELAEYVQQRAELVHALVGSITGEHLPATGWANQLRAADPDLARRLAVWRAATGITDHPHPLGPDASPTPAVRAQLAEQLPPHITADLGRRPDAPRRDPLSGPVRCRSDEPARGPQPVRDLVPRPEHDPLLARAYHRDQGRGVRR